MPEQLWWWVARSSGIVALVASGLSVIWGLLYATKLLQGRPSPKWLLATHRFLATTTVVGTAGHILALVLDGFVHFGWLEVLVPLASTWKPVPVALGVIAMYLLAAVQLTSVYMSKIPRRWWRRIHRSSYLLFWLCVAHGATAGTDAGGLAYIATSALLVLGVVFMTGYHVLTQRWPAKAVARPSDRGAVAAP